MKKVTAFVGSARKGNTYRAVRQVLDNLEAQGGVECEIVALSDYTLKTCRGCMACFDRGEEHCPLKDDRDVLMDRIAASDGVIFATPNYLFQVSGLLKVFLDRFGFAGHRPRYFGKTFTSIVTQGIGGGDKIVEYLDFTAGCLGFNPVKGVCLTALEPRTAKDQQRIDRALAEHSRRFHAAVMQSAYPAPSLFKLMWFRISRTSIKDMLDERSRDYRYYAEKGWFTSDYYYPAPLGLFKRAAGALIDSLAPTMRRMMSRG